MNDAKEVKKKLDKILGSSGREEAGKFLVKFFEGAVSGEKYFKQAIDELKDIKEKDRENLQAIIEEMKKFRPKEIEKMKVWVLNQPDFPQFPKEVGIKGFPRFPDSVKLEKPKWWQDPKDYTELVIEAAKAVVGEIGKQGQRDTKAKIINKYTGEAIPVRLVDKEGRRFYDAITQAIGAMPTYAGPRNFTIRIAYDANQNPQYIGYAAFGTSPGTSRWRIKKITYDANQNPTAVQWAGNTDNLTKEWDERTTYSYG